MGGGGQFGLDFLVGQRHGIISCFRVLVLMREGGSTIQRVGLEVCLLGGGAEQQVAQVDATSSTQVGVRKAFQGWVTVMIAGTGIPVAGPGIRTELHGTVGHRSTRIGVSVEACPDERVYIVHIGQPLRRASQACAKSAHKNSYFHQLIGFVYVKICKEKNVSLQILRL